MEWGGKEEMIFLSFFSFFFESVYVPFLSERARVLVKFTTPFVCVMLIYIYIFSIVISFNHKTGCQP